MKQEKPTKGQGGTVIGYRYRHKKGNIYVVTAIAEHTETGEELVIYSDADGKIWARPRPMFEDGRFSLISPCGD